MSKELIENLLIEFDEMGFEPTILCDTKKEIDSFRNRLKQVLDYLKAIDKASHSEALECLEEMWELSCDSRKPEYILYETIKQALIQAQEKEKVLKIMFTKTVSIFQMSCCKNADEYNDLKFNDNEKLTKEEFDLLKRWIE